MTDDNVAKRREIQELLVKAKFYRMAATLFLIVGVAVFIVMYFKKIDGDPMHALRNPILLISLVVPFLPAAVLAKKADKAHKKLMKLTATPEAKA